MFKLLKKRRFVKFICFILVAAFSINIAGCGNEDNGVPESNITNPSIGTGANTVGYTVYAESTFDPMTKNLFMGYLLLGREFTLVVVPGEKNDDGEYVLKDPENILFTTAQAGVYKYNDDKGSYDDPTRKLLLYYVTDVELRSWFDYFEEDDNFMSNAMDFASSKVDVEKPSRFKCKQLVNMGSGLNANAFCDGIIKNSTGIFTKPETGGMFLFFGYGSIEGYITYDDINDYEGSNVANNLVGNLMYRPSDIGPFNFKYILDSYDGGIIRGMLTNSEYEYDYSNDQINSFLTGTKNEELLTDIIYLYTEMRMNAASPGHEKLKTTYELIGSGLLTDNNKNNLSDLKNLAMANKEVENEEQEKWAAIYEMVEMIDGYSDFVTAAKKEAFDIKLSVALYSRYDSVFDYPDADKLTTGLHYNTKVNVNGNVGYEDTRDNLINGKDNSSNGSLTNNSYLLLVTADGFVFDRGTESDQIAMGASDMFDMGTMLAELVKMDGCPNETLAAKMYNLIANLKIYAGASLAIAGVSAMAIAGIGLAVASVIGKIAMFTAVAPVPGARIAALIVVGIAGLVALGAGLLTLFDGIKEKNRLKGLGASETNYCKSYVATFNQLFTSLSLTIPVYHYNIPRETNDEINRDLSVNYCKEGAYNEDTRKCEVVDSKTGGVTKSENPISVPLYYYANREQSEKLSLDGCPMLMYFKDGQLVDSISGATTPSFVVEMLRLWGLLAMREIVYQAQIEGNTINVYHTTSANARTHTILGAEYCLTTDYMKELNLEFDDNDFCYQFDGAKGEAVVDLNKFEYIYASKEDRVKSLLSVNIPEDKTGINDVILTRAIYNEYFSSLASTKFYNYKNNKGINVLELREEFVADFDSNVDLSLVDWANIDASILGNIRFKRLIEETSEYEYIDLNGEIVDKASYGGYSFKYVVGQQKYFVVGNSIFVLKEVQGETEIVLEKIATFNGDVSTFDDISTYLNGEEDDTKYELKDFLDYISGSLTFNETTKETIPIYFTVTVKESPQANYYVKNGKKTTCDSGKYSYYRPNTFLWFDGKYECHADAKAKDKPYSTINFDENDVRYYTASVLVGTITITLKDTGDTTIDVSWGNEGV